MLSFNSFCCLNLWAIQPRKDAVDWHDSPEFLSVVEVKKIFLLSKLFFCRQRKTSWVVPEIYDLSSITNCSPIPWMTNDLLEVTRTNLSFPSSLDDHFVYINEVVNSRWVRALYPETACWIADWTLSRSLAGTRYLHVFLDEKSSGNHEGDTCFGVTKIQYSCISLPADRERGTR